MVYTALGDSITAGKNATSPFMTYPYLLETALQNRTHHAATHVLAEPGWTSKALLTSVMQSPPDLLYRSSTVSIWVGGNNLINAGMAMLQGAPPTILQKALANYQSDISLLIRLIRRQTKGTILLCTQYNPFPNSPIAAAGIDALNHAIRTIAQRHSVQLAPVHNWFAGREPQLIEGYRDGKLTGVMGQRSLPIHPNNQGHRVIARGLFPLIR
jgi:acyl-CoA thioesterase I